MRENTLKIRSMALGFIPGRTIENTRAGGTKGSNMASAFILSPTKK